MTQTVGQLTFRNVTVELSTDGSTWLDISGSTSAVNVSGGARQVHEIRPLFSDRPVVRTGSADALKIKINTIFTEVADEARSLLHAAYAANATISLRWSVTGGVPGDTRYVASGAWITKPDFPGGAVDDSKPMMAEYEVTAAQITEEII